MAKFNVSLALILVLGCSSVIYPQVKDFCTEKKQDVYAVNFAIPLPPPK